MAKKKKPASNPARGFATTSVASKPKPERIVEPPEPATSKKDITPSAVPQVSSSAQAHGGASAQPKNPQKTPEELEAQLELDELQLLVEKHATKVRREARRQILKVQTDQRVLRSQAQNVTVQDWVPRDVLDTIISLAQAESNDSNRRQGQKSLTKTLSEEDAMSKLWILDLTFRGMGFTEENIDPVLKWLCANAAVVDSTSSTWGFAEGLEWMALDQCEGHSFSYDGPKPSLPIGESPATSRPATPPPADVKSQIGSTKEANSSDRSNVTSTPVESDIGEVAVSDLDSDIEPDQLVPTYLNLKCKLFEIDPDALDTKPKKSKGTKAKTAKASNTAAVRKLLSQLQQLESDALFDQDAADTEWPVKRNQIAQAKATEKKSFPETKATPSSSTEAANDQEADPAKDKEGDRENQDNGNASDDDGELLGDMFSAIPDDDPATKDSIDQDSQNVILRDFGKQSGLSPRKVLEESVRSRDPGAKLWYKLISPTTYSCRHSLVIKWSKGQDTVFDGDIPGFDCNIQKFQSSFSATVVATVSVEQSESLISTVALFSICAPLVKEEKVYIRLPSNWRDYYRELLDHRKERLDAEDRQTVKRLRTIVQEQIEEEESDDVVLTNRFKMRNQAANGSSAATSGQSTPTSNNQSLRDLWHHKAAANSYQHMLQSRMNLPVFNFRESILATIDQNQVTIICGETGCGKSTQIPSFVLEHELLQGKQCKIYCTEPRRISAISLAQRVSDELGEGPKDLGTPRSLVGYAIRLETKTSSQSRLVFATVGVVLRMLESSRGLDDLTHLIIDEVHERNIDTDFLLIILRSLMIRRPELKVILMSATVDADKFSRYLNSAPVMMVPGRTFPVETRYLEDAIELTHYDAVTNDKLNDSDTSENEEGSSREKSGIPSKLPGYSATTRNVLSSYDEYGIDYDLIIRLIENVAFDATLARYSSAFLVFLPGMAEIRQLNDMLLSHPSFDKQWLIYPLHSSISSEDQQAAFLLPPPETGVTIPDITCVIDTGKHKEMRFDERRQLSRLTQSFISRANAKQRRGRAGRVQEGLCFHLFTRYRHDTMMTDQQTPEMLRLSLQDLVMRTKICKLGDIEKTLSEALDPPTSRNIRRAIDALIEVDALTSGEELTPLGRQLAKLPLDAHLGKLVLFSCMFACADVAITIAAILSSKSPFLTPFGAKQRADVARFAFKKGDSDLITAYNAYKTWKAICTTPGRSEAQFCHKNFLSAQNLGNIEDLKAQLLSSLVDAGFIAFTSEERKALSRYRSTSRHRMFVTIPPQHDLHSHNDILVNSVIATALYPKILTREGKGWRNIANNQTVSLSPTSVNRITPINPTTARFLSYYHIMQSSNKFYNAHSTSIAHPLPMILTVGADNMDFKLAAGIITLPGNVLRFSVANWRIAVALKVLRRRLKEILAGCWKNPGRQLSGREKEWMELFFRILSEKWEREEKIRERAAGKGK
ncbi:ATP-dependent RNA helicase A [Aaosphaeria arxii CBS 175.79]|uniref:RNA helicase n=1 Tax=Aaosphaeria arxii CBS 175.79 TaxID=1450172 RepID=A0A6A5XGQ7_9PLEO|nr:ATP-dependent RNA helicase A [Aaosphaeria arxii CBS 175.79]KAF2012272.1 ATP-dependent RNA helicase A [Aaosphaeria arxii CBS 175.79]